MNNKSHTKNLNNLRWYDNYKDELINSINRHFKTLSLKLFLLLLFIILLSFFMILMSQSNSVALTIKTTISHKDLLKLIQVRSFYYSFMWADMLVEIFLLLACYVLGYPIYILVKFMYEGFYRLILKPHNKTTSLYVLATITLRKYLDKANRILAWAIYIIFSIFFIYLMFSGIGFRKLINFILIFMLLFIPVLFFLNYYLIWRRYRSSDIEEKKKIESYFFSKDAIRSSFLTIISTVTFIGILGYALVPFYFIVTTRISTSLIHFFSQKFDYPSTWATIKNTQVILGAKTLALPNPNRINASFDWLYEIEKLITNKEYIIPIQHTLFIIISVALTLEIGIRAIVNIYLKKNVKQLKKVLLTTLYTMLVTSILSLILKYLFYISLGTWGIYAIILSIIMNLTLTAQTIE